MKWHSAFYLNKLNFRERERKREREREKSLRYLNGRGRVSSCTGPNPMSSHEVEALGNIKQTKVTRHIVRLSPGSTFFFITNIMSDGIYWIISWSSLCSCGFLIWCPIYEYVIFNAPVVVDVCASYHASWLSLQLYVYLSI